MEIVKPSSEFDKQPQEIFRSLTCHKIQIRLLEARQDHADQSLRLLELLELGTLFFKLLPTLEESIMNNMVLPNREESMEFLRELTFKKDPQQLDRLCAEVLLCRDVDNFQSFVADLLAIILQERPEILRSKRTVEVEEVLRCSSLEEFVKQQANHQIEELTYGGFPKVMKFLKTHFSIPLILNQPDRKNVEEAIACRNIFVHNRGKVNEQFMAQSGRTDVELGQQLYLDEERALELSHSLSEVADAITENISHKFGIVSAPRLKQSRNS